MLFATACHFAAKKHANQRRKNTAGSPYIEHPLEVAKFIAEMPEFDRVPDLNQDVLCAAVLHDTIEDTDTHANELRVLFGERITQMVLDVTDDKSLDFITRKQLQVEHVGKLSKCSVLIKLADTLSNLSGLASDPPKEWSAEQMLGYLNWKFCIWSQVIGMWPEMDRRLRAVFDHHGIVYAGEEDLEKYYEIFRNKKPRQPVVVPVVQNGDICIGQANFDQTDNGQFDENQEHIKLQYVSGANSNECMEAWQSSYGPECKNWHDSDYSDVDGDELDNHLQSSQNQYFSQISKKPDSPNFLMEPMRGSYTNLYKIINDAHNKAP